MTHRSREGWADPMDEEPCGPVEHVCRLPKAARIAVVGLTAAVFLVLVALGLMAVYVYQANQFVQGRGEYRDTENDRTNQRINDAICDLLDQLPEGGLLERPRAKYGCGPGIPISDLPPEIQDQLADRTPGIKRPDPETADAPSPAPVPSPNFAGGVVASEPGTNPESVPPNPGTSPAPAPPLVDLGPITDLICATPVPCN